jgi:uncharacterized protein
MRSKGKEAKETTMAEAKKGTMSVTEAGRKGGEKVSSQRGREFYEEIGKKGGQAVSQDREHMAEIGHKGGERVRELVAKGKHRWQER